MAKGSGEKTSPSLIGLFVWTGFAQAQSQRTDTDVEESGDAFLEHLRTGHPVSQHFLVLLTQPRTRHRDPSLGPS